MNHSGAFLCSARPYNPELNLSSTCTSIANYKSARVFIGSALKLGYPRSLSS